MATSSNVSIRGLANKNDQAAIDISSVRAEDQKIAFSACEDNILKSYSNVTYRWTMAPLTPKQVTQLQTGIGIGSLSPGLANIVICSGGGKDADRAATFYGSPEYFIDNIEINTLATPTKESGLSGNLTMNFDVIEPYSLGLFIQSLQAAALRSTYDNYLECTWLMQVDFIGVDVDGRQQLIPDATRLYTQKLQQISFVATEAGSKYQVKTLDFNLEAFNNVYGTFPNAANFQGATVQEALSGLAKVLNDAQELAVKQGLIKIADEYEIVVKAPFSFDAAKVQMIDNTEIQNKMANSKFPAGSSSDKSSGTAKAPAKSSDGRGAPEYSIRKFAFPPKDDTRIVDMIREVMISSEFITNATQPENVSKDDGMITWYRISVVTEYKGTNIVDTIQNRPAYKFTFVIGPYRVHHSVAKIPLGPTLGMTDTGLKSTIKKQYNYLYTGLNDDIIRWELKFDNTFYTSMPFQNAVADRDIDGIIGEQPSNTNASPASSGSKLITHSGRLMRDKSGSYIKPMGGSTVDKADIRTARAFERAIMLGTEMITLNMTILGDPYYLSRSGAFLEQVGATPGSQINNDKTMASESGEVRVFLRFRTPIDAPRPGGALFIFPASGYSDSPFGGLYRIRSVKSKFHEGVFTQDLDLFRDRGQQPEEITKFRSDPSLLFNSAIGVDPRINGYNGTPAAVANPGTPEAGSAFNQGSLGTRAPEAPATTPSATVNTTEADIYPQNGTFEVTKQGNPIPTNLPPAPFNKTGPDGRKLPYTEELENQLKNAQ
jgi:hypothetical protein